MPPRKCVYCVSAFRTIEKTGDSSTTLRMTCCSTTLSQMYPTHVRLNCHPEEAGLKVGQTFLSAHIAEEALSAVSGTGRRQAEDASAQMCLLCFCLQDNRKDGRFFDYAQNDMLFDNSQSNVPNTRAPKLSS